MDSAPMDARGPWHAMLAALPMRNVAARIETERGDTLVLCVPRKRPWFVRWPPMSWIIPCGMERRLTLDSLGAQIWRMCDGRRTVGQVVDAFGDVHRLTFHEARAAVTGYLKLLLERGALAMDVGEIA